MLVAAIAGFAAAFTTGSDTLAFVAGAAAGGLLAAAFGVLVIWLNTNQYATGLAVSLFGYGFSAFVGVGYVGQKLSERTPFEVPVLAQIPFIGPALFKQHPMVYIAIALIAATDVVPLPQPRRAGAARGRRVARVGACAGLQGALDPPGWR